MNQLYEIIHINNDTNENRTTIGIFSNKEFAIEYIKKEFISKTPRSFTDLLPREGFNFYERFDYVSCYGSYNCSYLIKPIEIDPKHYLDKLINN